MDACRSRLRLLRRRASPPPPSPSLWARPQPAGFRTFLHVPADQTIDSVPANPDRTYPVYAAHTPGGAGVQVFAWPNDAGCGAAGGGSATDCAVDVADDG